MAARTAVHPIMDHGEAAEEAPVESGLLEVPAAIKYLLTTALRFVSVVGSGNGDLAAALRGLCCDLAAAAAAPRLPGLERAAPSS
jgi:hypothetical protein